MKNVIHQILKPNKVIRTLFGLLSFIFIVAYIWRYSFVWEYFFSVTHYILGLLIALIVGLIITTKLDKKLSSRTKSYFIVSLIQLLIIWSIAKPIREWQIESSLSKGLKIAESIEAYKAKFGSYPESLKEIENKLGKELPKWTNVGTRYWYDKNEDFDYNLRFLSYHGYMAYYSRENKNWTMAD